MNRFPSNICALFLMSLLVWKVLRSVDKSNEAVDFLCSVCAVLALLLAFAAFAQGLQELGSFGCCSFKREKELMGSWPENGW